jgi:hypothetical protein
MAWCRVPFTSFLMLKVLQIVRSCHCQLKKLEDTTIRSPWRWQLQNLAEFRKLSSSRQSNTESWFTRLIEITECAECITYYMLFYATVSVSDLVKTSVWLKTLGRYQSLRISCCPKETCGSIWRGAHARIFNRGDETAAVCSISTAVDCRLTTACTNETKNIGAHARTTIA